MSTSPSSAASAAIASPSRTSSTRPSTRATAGPAATAAAAALTRPGSRPVSRTRSCGAMRAASAFGERAAEPLVGACDECDARSGHALKLAAERPCCKRELRTATMRDPHGLGLLADRACASCARSRRPGSFSAAAHSLGYTQSAVSRQVAALEAVAGRRLFDRSRHGVTLTAAGHAPAAARDPGPRRARRGACASGRRGADRGRAGRLGAFATAAAGLVPEALASLPRELKVTLREGTTPALTRALRAGTLDLAILARTPPFRPPDAESPPLELTTLSERELVVGVPASHPFASARAVEVAAARGPGLGREPVRRGRLPARRLARAGRAPRRPLRRARLARQAADRRRRPGDHDARPDHARRAARRRQGRRRARRAAGDATDRAGAPARTARRPRRSRSPTR